MPTDLTDDEVLAELRADERRHWLELAELFRVTDSLSHRFLRRLALARRELREAEEDRDVMTLTELHNFLGEHLADIADVLPRTYKLTLVARYTGTDLADADVVIGDDDLAAARAAIERLACRQPHGAPSPTAREGGEEGE